MVGLTKLLIERITNYQNPNSVGSRLRAARSVHIRKIIDDIYAKKGCVKVLDVGGTPAYWNIFDRQYLQDRSCSILLVNLTDAGFSDDIFSSAAGNACNLDMFPDLSFDLV